MTPTSGEVLVRATRGPLSILSSYRELCNRDPDRSLLTFVDEDGNDRETLSARQLATAAEGIARALGEWCVRPGDRVVLVYPQSMDFVKALMGCLLAGVIPVPVYPPNPYKLSRDLPVFSSIVASSGACAALTNGEYHRMRQTGAVASFFRRDTTRWPEIPWRRTDLRHPPGERPITWHLPADPDEPALLQYTSGSTTQPRGVIITHGNLAHELMANSRDLGLRPDARIVFWVPVYHDLGLINGILNAVVGNGHFRFMSPLSFVQRPALWFEVMSRVRATHAAAPDFAFELSVRKTTPEMRRRWDLSALRLVMSAAEPIRPTVVRAFFAAFAPAGLSPEAFCPAYGLAENTVSVSVCGKMTLHLDRQALEEGLVVPCAESSPRLRVEYVGCGRVTKEETTVRIVDPETRVPCGPGAVGEIWVHSVTKGLGYYGLAEETQETFRARVAGEDDPLDYLRTGDLGFFHEGELFITGRHKDLIIVHGRNLYPQDIEDSVRGAHPLIRPGGVVAFAVAAARDAPAGEELVLLVETREAPPNDAGVEEMIRAVQERVYEDHDLRCHAVVVGRAGLVRKTTSGKVRRRACRQAFLNAELHSETTTIRVQTGQLTPPSSPAPTLARHPSLRGGADE